MKLQYFEERVRMEDRYLYKAKGDKRYNDGSWYEGYLIKDKDGDYQIYENCTYRTVMKDTICQCTGRIDIYGNLIFEHDIVKERYSEYIGEVKFGEHEKGYGWYIEWISEKAKFYRVDFLYWQKEVSLDVIGNIFDNPELLEK